MARGARGRALRGGGAGGGATATGEPARTAAGKHDRAAVSSRARRRSRGRRQGCRVSIRMLKARPGFTAVAVITLALGIGANTAIFSVVHALLLEPLPFPQPERLVMLWEARRGESGRHLHRRAPNYLDWQRGVKAFESTGIWEYLNFNFSGDGEAERVPGIRVSASTFTDARRETAARTHVQAGGGRARPRRRDHQHGAVAAPFRRPRRHRRRSRADQRQAVRDHRRDARGVSGFRTAPPASGCRWRFNATDPVTQLPFVPVAAARLRAGVALDRREGGARRVRPRGWRSSTPTTTTAKRRRCRR